MEGGGNYISHCVTLEGWFNFFFLLKYIFYFVFEKLGGGGIDHFCYFGEGKLIN